MRAIWNIFILVLVKGYCEFSTLFHPLSYLEKQYCINYCNGYCNKLTCDESIRNLIRTNKYEIVLKKGRLNFNWISQRETNLSSIPITNKKNATVLQLSVTGIQNNDHRFRCGAYYLQALGIASTPVFKIYSDTVVAIERVVYDDNGTQSLTFDVPETANFDDLKDYVKHSINSLKNITIIAKKSFWSPALILDDDIFKGKLNVKILAFVGICIANLTRNTFADLKNLRNLSFSQALIDNLEVLSFSKTLQKNVEYLRLYINQTVDIKYFKNYTKLKIIEAKMPLKPFDNLTALICYHNSCTFNLGINGVKCPEVCHCHYNYDDLELNIYCKDRALTQIPALPIPIVGSTALLFQNNSLSRLPDKSTAGYTSLRRLDVRKNPLTHLSIDRMPTNLDYFDISSTEISTMTNDVIKYIENISVFRQHGNLWKPECHNKPLLKFFRNLSSFIRVTDDVDLIFNRRRGEFSYIIPWLTDLKTERFIFLNESRALFQLIGFYKMLENDALYLLEDFNREIRWANVEYESILLYHIGAPCPYRCECCHNHATDLFKIDCRYKGLQYFPDVVPLSDTLSPKHGTQLVLKLSNNKISKITIKMLPKNIRYVDLHNNSLESLDDEVLNFLRNVKEVKLAGNPWTCDCKSKSLLLFLRDIYPIEYYLTLERCHIRREDCPDACICCFDKSNWPSFMVDCRGRGLSEVPRLSDQVTYLDVRNNSIASLSPENRNYFRQRSQSSQLKLLLSINPWSCTCKDMDLLIFLKNISPYIADFTDIYCAAGERHLLTIEKNDICPSGTVYLLAGAMGLLVIVLAINFLVCFRKPILIWLYEHDVCLSLAARRELDLHKRFDAFLAFSHKDEALVEEFVDRLENDRPRFRLCYYLRDWLVGESIPDCINQSVKDSRRIIILMTENFLKSTWGRLEFRLALHATSKDRCKRLIVVLYPDVKNFDDLDSELRTYMVLNTYLERKNPNFWNRLIYSMPHAKFPLKSSPLEPLVSSGVK